jgi:hypothetical protein
LFAIAVARLLLSYFGIGLTLLDRPDRGRTRRFDTKTNRCVGWCRTIEGSVERK